jgi:DNA repair photolyase
MQYRHIHVKSLINTITRKDYLFDGSYTIDPYQNCEFNCSYCDSTLEEVIYIKSNAEKILKEKINYLPKKRIIIGSVHDAYQPIEKKLEITRNILAICHENDQPVHIITKSDLITRDLDIIKEMNDVLVTVTILSLDAMISRLFERDAPPPMKRYQTIRTLTSNKIKTGVAMIPILPFITDEMVEQVLKESIKHHASYFLHGYLELKGDQKQQYLEIIKTHFPALIDLYEELYDHTIRPNDNYIRSIDTKVERLLSQHQISSTIQ